MGELAAEERIAAENFEALGICRQLAEAAVALKWKVPSPIQEQAIPHLLQGTHLMMRTGAALLLRWTSRTFTHQVRTVKYSLASQAKSGHRLCNAMI